MTTTRLNRDSAALTAITGLAVLAITGRSAVVLLHDVAGAPLWVSWLGALQFAMVTLLAALAVCRPGSELRKVVPLVILAVAAVMSVTLNSWQGWRTGGPPVAVLLGIPPVLWAALFAEQHAMTWLLFGRRTMRLWRQDVAEQLEWSAETPSASKGKG